MHTRLNILLGLACALGLSVVAACRQESSPPQQALSSALERPLEACQEQDEACRLSPTLDPAAACQDSVRTCLQSVASWMQESRALIEKCREESAQCLISQPTEALSCNDQFEGCVAPAFQPNAASAEDAGASDKDAGVTTTIPVTQEAAGSTSPPPVAGSGGSSEPTGLPPPLPGSDTAADACLSELQECLTPGADLIACAEYARTCLRWALLPAR
jgi:hypothetical protein